MNFQRPVAKVLNMVQLVSVRLLQGWVTKVSAELVLHQLTPEMKRARLEARQQLLVMKARVVIFCRALSQGMR